MRWDRPWLRYLGIAVAYAGIYGLLRVIWIPHWQLTVGFRLACLLIIPPRYWPALFVGQAAALGKLAYDCVGQLGVPWAIAVLFTSMSLSMPAVFLFRRYWPVVDTQKRVVVRSLLLCILVMTLVSTAGEVLEYSLMQGLPSETHWSLAHAGHFAYLWLLGGALGTFMVVPLVLWVYTEGDLHLRNIYMRVSRSRVLLTAAAFILPCLYGLAYAIEYSPLVIDYSHLAWVRHVAQIAMLLAPAWLAMRYGWQGASLGCMMANLAVVLSMPALRDPSVLQTQELMLISSILWLLLGARVSTIRQQRGAA